MSVKYERVYVTIDGPVNGPFIVTSTVTSNDGITIRTETTEKQFPTYEGAVDFLNNG